MNFACHQISQCTSLAVFVMSIYTKQAIYIGRSCADRSIINRVPNIIIHILNINNCMAIIPKSSISAQSLSIYLSIYLYVCLHCMQAMYHNACKLSVSGSASQRKSFHIKWSSENFVTLKFIFIFIYIDIAWWYDQQSRVHLTNAFYTFLTKAWPNKKALLKYHHDDEELTVVTTFSTR
jgi:hypothetical protein